MNRRGFTLIEVLAVIAILAILAIIAIPNVIKLYNNARKETFLVQAKNVLSSAMDEYTSSALHGEVLSENTYCYIENDEYNNLNMTGDSKIYYKIIIDASGVPTSIIVFNNTFSVTASSSIDNLTISDVMSEGSTYYETVSTCGSNTVKIVKYSCISSSACEDSTSIPVGTEIKGTNGEFFIVMKNNGNGTYNLMTKYLLVESENGYEQGGSSTEGKALAYGSSSAINTGGNFAGDAALSYIESINSSRAPATPAGKNGIPTLVQMCDYANDISGSIVYTISDSTVTPNTEGTLNGISNMVLGNTDSVPYEYWTSTALSSNAVWTIDAGGFFDDSYYHSGGGYGVRPIFMVLSSSID